jgi:hypothetical protein
VIAGTNTADVSVTGRYCALGERDLVADPAEQTYPFGGLLGNTDPLLTSTLEDDSDAFAEIRETAESFDSQFDGGLRRLAETERSIGQVEDRLSTTTDPSDSRELGTELDNLSARKKAIASKLQSLLDDTFESIEPAIDEDARTQTLWLRTKDMYRLALDSGNPGQVYGLCANAETTGNENLVHVKDGKIFVGTRAVERASVLSADEADLVRSRIGHVSDAKLSDIQSKIDLAKSRIAAKRQLSEEDVRKLNLLLDVETAVRNELLYP